jgi:hypothetical protein
MTDWSVLDLALTRWIMNVRMQADSVWSLADYETMHWVVNIRCDPILPFQKYRNNYYQSIVQRTDPRFDLFYSLNEFRQLKATDPRDHLYGLCGITKSNLTPNYQLPASRVYYEFARNEVVAGNMAVLHFAGSGVLLNGWKTGTMPSWVPDWQGRSNSRTLRDILPYYSRYSAGISSESHTYKFCEKCEILYVDGIICSEILHNQTRTFGPLRANSDYCKTVYPTGIPMLQALFRTLCRDIDHHTGKRLNASTPLFYELAVGFFIDILPGTYSTTWDKESHDHVTVLRKALQLNPSATEAEVYGFLDRNFVGDTCADGETHQPQWPKYEGGDVMRTLWAKYMNVSEHAYYTLYTTCDGYLCLGPRYCKARDLLCAILGTRSLHVLRKHEDGFEYVGPCFVLGFMDGEALRGVEEGKFKIQEFNIR